MSFLNKIHFVSLAFLFLTNLVHCQETLYELDSASATVYYDLTNELCGDASKGDPFTPNWAETSGINHGIPICESQASPARSLSDIGTNRIVAINWELIHGDLAKWCGKEVEIYQNGQKFEFAEGPLILWDACAAASSAQIVDVSAAAFTQLKGGTCSGTNPTGLVVKVVDSNIWQPIGVEGSGGPSAGGSSVDPAATPSTTTSSMATSTTLSTVSTRSTTPATLPIPSSSFLSSSDSTVISTTQAKTSSSRKYNPPAGKQHTRPTLSHTAYINGGAANALVGDTSDTTVQTSTTAIIATSVSNISASKTNTISASASSTQVAAGVGTSATCTFGAWQCDGLSLEVCNYVTPTDLGWETIETCETVCQVMSGGSIDCE